MSNEWTWDELAERLAALSKKYGQPPPADVADVPHLVLALDARTAYTLYESMRTSELLDLQAAHVADAMDAKTPESIAFGAGRLALIAAVLKEREGVHRRRAHTITIRVRYKQAGVHVHCRVFTATGLRTTFEKSGDLVFRAGVEWNDVRELLATACELLPEEE